MRGIFAPLAAEHHAGSPMLLFRLQRFSGRIADFIGNRMTTSSSQWRISLIFSVCELFAEAACRVGCREGRV